MDVGLACKTNLPFRPLVVGLHDGLMSGTSAKYVQ